MIIYIDFDIFSKKITNSKVPNDNKLRRTNKKKKKIIGGNWILLKCLKRKYMVANMVNIDGNNGLPIKKIFQK